MFWYYFDDCNYVCVCGVGCVVLLFGYGILCFDDCDDLVLVFCGFCDCDC